MDARLNADHAASTTLRSDMGGNIPLFVFAYSPALLEQHSHIKQEHKPVGEKVLNNQLMNVLDGDKVC
jgi:hypothetical protein